MWEGCGNSSTLLCHVSNMFVSVGFCCPCLHHFSNVCYSLLLPLSRPHPSNPKALLEAMEQQEVSVAKAGLVASLPARAAVIAAANPVGGRYDRGKTTQENLKLSAAMMSRFDLTFVLLDRPNEALDQAVSEHVLAMHSGGRGWVDEVDGR